MPKQVDNPAAVTNFGTWLPSLKTDFVADAVGDDADGPVVVIVVLERVLSPPLLLER